MTTKKQPRKKNIFSEVKYGYLKFTYLRYNLWAVTVEGRKVVDFMEPSTEVIGHIRSDMPETAPFGKYYYEQLEDVFPPLHPKLIQDDVRLFTMRLEKERERGTI